MLWEPRDECILKMMFTAVMKVAKSVMNKDQRSPLDFVNVKFLANLKIVTSVELIRQMSDFSGLRK